MAYHGRWKLYRTGCSKEVSTDAMIPERTSYEDGHLLFFRDENSLTVAKDIAKKTGGRLIPVASRMEDKDIATDAEAIGLVFPVYYGDLPVVVKEFAQRLGRLQGKYVFAVCTYGGAAMASVRTLKKIIYSRGGKLSAAFGVHMPQNSFHKPKEQHAKLYSAWKSKLEFIADKIKKNHHSKLLN